VYWRRDVPIKHLPAPSGAYQRCPPFRGRVTALGSCAANMSPARIVKLEVQGFRSFHLIQTLDIDAPIIAIWGPNSQGKTSLAEAIEFLLTGRIVRRELMASSQDEFADALRNAHMPDATPVFVRADVIDWMAHDTQFAGH
jgi:AAA domain